MNLGEGLLLILSYEEGAHWDTEYQRRILEQARKGYQAQAVKLDKLDLDYSPTADNECHGSRSLGQG